MHRRPFSQFIVDISGKPRSDSLDMESDGYPTAEDGYNEDADGSYAMSTVTGSAADPTNAEGKNTLYIADTFFYPRTTASV